MRFYALKADISYGMSYVISDSASFYIETDPATQLVVLFLTQALI